MITLRTLGECVVEVDGAPYGPDADTAFAALLYLAAERGRHVSRQRFADLFWPRLPAARARHALRQLLYRLRALRVPVEATRERLWFPDRAVAPTFGADPTLARLREAQEAGTLVVGPCLPGYAPTFSPAFAEWVDDYRSVVEAQVRKALMDAADEHRLRGEWAARAELARQVLRIDPLHQGATHALAECA
jgi:DNA-binding SARP family transcriptional activator